MANLQLLQKIHDHIQEFPQSVDMDVWVRGGSVTKDTSSKSWDGFSGCLGGLAIHLSGGTIYRGEQRSRNFDVARARLELSKDETGHLLYFNYPGFEKSTYSRWMDPLLRANKGTEEYADVVCAVLRECIRRHTPKVQEEKSKVPLIQVQVRFDPQVPVKSSPRWAFWKPQEITTR